MSGAVIQHPALMPDRNQAETFLSWLDRDEANFTFQTFDDNADRKTPELARVLHGTLDQHWDELVRLNRQGAGVFVTVNETDGNGRKVDNITRVRAVWQEDDDGFGGDLPVKPHIVVQSSPGKHHRYVLVSAAPGEGLDDDSFEGVEQRLVDDYGSDNSAKDRARVLRLPGFFHAKVNAKKGLNGTPHRVQVVEWNAHPRLSWAQVVDALPPAQAHGKRKAVPGTAGKPEPRAVDTNGPDGLQRVPAGIDPGVAASLLGKAEEARNAADNTITDDDYQNLWMALQVLDGGDRETWISVGHQLKSIANEGWGWTLWHEWSKTQPGYEGEDDCRWYWDGFEPTRSNWRGVFARAQDNGWTNPKSKVGQQMTLQQAAAHAIDTGQLISRETAKSLDPNIKEHRDQILLYREQEREWFRRNHGYVMYDGKLAVVSRMRREDTGEWNTEFSARNAVEEFYMDRPLPRLEQDPETGTWSTRWSDDIVKDWKRREDKFRYRGIVFKPEAGRVADNPLVASAALNLFIGFAWAPEPGDCSLILDHIRTVWCRGNQAAFDYVIKWLAQMVQHPEELGKVAVVLRSGQGAGKNIIVNILLKYFGYHGIMLTNPNDLSGFNDYLARSVLVVLNEAMWGGNHQLANEVKSLITDDTVMTEKKFYSKVTTRNCSHYLILTNEDWAVPVGRDDRRYFMLDVSDERKDDGKYFNDLIQQIEAGGDKAFIHYLTQVDVSEFKPSEFPNLENQIKLDHKIRSASKIEQWWFTALTDGEFRFETRGEVVHERVIEWPEDEELEIEVNHVYKSYQLSARGNAQDRPESVSMKMAKMLGLDGGVPKKRKRTPRVGERSLGGRDRTAFYVLPPLTKARAAADAYLKQPGPWHFDEYVESPETEEVVPENPPVPQKPPMPPTIAGTPKADAHNPSPDD